MYSNCTGAPQSGRHLVDEDMTAEQLVDVNLAQQNLAQQNLAPDNNLEELCLADNVPDNAISVGRNCRINIVDKHEIVRLNEELQDLQRWFIEYGQDGILFPNSVINAFAPTAFLQAA